jgi:hypothetical protein
VRATRNASLARTHEAYYRRWRGYLRGYLRDAVRRGEMAAGRSIRDATDILAAGVDGLWLCSAFESQRFAAGRRRQLLDQLLSAVVASPAS